MFGRIKNGKFCTKKASIAKQGRKLFGVLEPIPVKCEQKVLASPTSNTIDRHTTNSCINWDDGRRIVELGHLASQLKCSDCDGNLMI